MTGWALACLAVIALALVAMAIAQMVVAREVGRLARQASETARELQREMRPILERLQKVTDDAAKATAIGLAQVQRVDDVVTMTAARIDETISVVQSAILEPVRHGAAFVTGLRAVLSVLRGKSGRARHTHEDDEALFIG